MKLKLLILCASAASLCADSRVLNVRIVEDETRGIRLLPREFEPPLPPEVYMAFPNNPALYRYLSRNPRYIPIYLGE